MKRIVFTAKHIMIVVVLLFLLLAVGSGIWFTSISSKKAEIGKLEKEFADAETELVQLNQQNEALAGKKNLLDSNIVNELPRFSKGIQIQEYLTGLENKVAKNKIQLKQISASDTLLFESPTDPNKKVFSSEIVLEYSALGKKELFAFIHALENDQRFIKVTDYSYSFSSEEGNGTVYDSTLLFNLYYLNVTEEVES